MLPIKNNKTIIIISIFIILVLINLIKCQNDFTIIDENHSIINNNGASNSYSNINSNSESIINDNPTSTNIYTFDLMKHELQQHYDEIEHKLALSLQQESSSLPNEPSKEINEQNEEDTTELNIQQQISLSSTTNEPLKNDEFNNNDEKYLINITPKNLISLTTLIPDYIIANSNSNDDSSSSNIQPITITSSLNLTNEFINDNNNTGSTIIYNDHLTTDNIYELSSQHSTDMINDDNISSDGNIDEIMSFDMKKNILYTEDLNNNDIKMRNLTELETNNDTESSELLLLDKLNNNNNDTIDNNDTIITTDDIIDEPEMLIGTTITPSVLSSLSPLIVINRIKQGKQIQIERKRLLKKYPHERLQQYIEDPYIRKPLAAIVDPTINSLDKTISLWKNALRPNTALDIILLGINATGVSVIYNFTNTRTFLAGLNSLKESEPGNPFFGILKATELIPYDSAIFISAATTPEDTILGQQAGIALLKKRIRLYLVWFGDQKYNTNNNNNEPSKETSVTGGILGKIAIRSGGEIFHMRNDSDGFHELEENMITLISDNYRGSQEIEIPVDTTISDLQIKIDTMMRTATLQTPTGEINLKKFMKLQFSKFKHYYEINIPIESISYSNKLLLILLPEIEYTNYCVDVTGIKRRKFKNETNHHSIDFSAENIIDNARDGRILSHQNLRFPTSKDVEFIDRNNTYTNLIDIDNTDAGNKTAAAQQAGVLQGITKIEMGIQSQVMVAPGMMAQLYFEITNLRSEPVFHSILVTDEQRFLRSLSQQSILLPPGQTITVTVTLMIPPATPQNTIDKITFTCQGNGQASQSVNLKVISNQERQDSTPPYINWAFGTRCDAYGSVYRLEECSSRFWSLEITAQDYESGILKISSTPSGLLYRIPFTVGATEPIHATYTASCCQPRVTISAYDISGNTRTHNIDVRDIVLTEASIAAIVLGVILLIVLIIALIGLIVWCCKRRSSASRDLPSYRSPPIERSRGG